MFDWFGHFVSMLGFVICPDSKKGKVGPGADPEAVLFIQSPLGKQTRIEK